MAREMKESGVSWIGKVPSSWKVVPIKVAFSEIKTKNTDGAITNALKFKFGEIVSKANFDSETDDYVADTILNYTIVEPRTIMINGLNLNYDFKTLRTGLVKEKGVITSAYLALKPDENMVCAEYATYLFKGYETKMAFHNMGSGIRLTLGFKEFKNQPLLLPMLQEQKAIADFLDKQCAEIDAVIAKTKATIDEYKKLKQSVITEAITKGIRSNRAMKNSGNLWYGEIPSDWDIRKLKYMFRIKKDIAGKEGYTVLSITQRGIMPKNIASNEGQIAENYSNYQLVEPGDFAMNHMDLLTGWVDISKYHGVTSPDYRVFVLLDKENNHSQYYLYLMQMCYTNRIFYGLGQGVSGMGRWRLQADKFLNFTIPVPSYEEQKEIAEYLDKKCAEIYTLIAKKTALLEEMESYKKSVIYENVTGKKEV